MRRLNKKCWPHYVDIERTRDNESTHNEFIWAKQTYDTKNYYVVNGAYYSSYYFKNELDATMFRLRWK